MSAATTVAGDFGKDEPTFGFELAVDPAGILTDFGAGGVHPVKATVKISNKLYCRVKNYTCFSAQKPAQLKRRTLGKSTHMTGTNMACFQ
jgi:hypothetical protein